MTRHHAWERAERGTCLRIFSDGSEICLRSWDRTLDTKEQQNCLSGLSTSGCGVLLLYESRNLSKASPTADTVPSAISGCFTWSLLILPPRCRTRKCAGYIAQLAGRVTDPTIRGRFAMANEGLATGPSISGGKGFSPLRQPKAHITMPSIKCPGDRGFRETEHTEPHSSLKNASGVRPSARGSMK